MATLQCLSQKRQSFCKCQPGRTLSLLWGMYIDLIKNHCVVSAFKTFVCVCICTSACMHRHSSCIEVRDHHGFSRLTLFELASQLFISLQIRLVSLMSSGEVFCLCSPLWDYRPVLPTVSDSSVSSGDQNSVLHTCVTNAALTEQFLQPHGVCTKLSMYISYDTVFLLLYYNAYHA